MIEESERKKESLNSEFIEGLFVENPEEKKQVTKKEAQADDVENSPASGRKRSVGASSMLFLSRSLGGLVRPRSPPLGSGKVGVRPNPGRYPGPWVVERPASS